MQDDSQLLGYLPQYIPDNDQELITPANLRFVLGAFVEGKVNRDQLSLLAQLASPRFTGVPQVPTAPAGTNSDQVASTAYVLSAIANVAGGKNLSELVLEQDVVGGNWYLTPAGIWEARRNFHAVADPVNGPNWLLKAGFGGQLTSIPAANITDATAAGRAMLTAASASVQRGLVGNMNIPAGKWGNHPALLTEDGPDGGWAYVLKALSTLANVQVVQQSGAPTVTGFLPASGAVGDTVTITGSLFTKAKAVTFNGTAAIFQVLNATTIVATLPAGATTGPVAVQNDNGTGTSAANFTVVATATPTPAGDTVKPDVFFTVPANGATLPPNTDIQLAVVANDNVGVVSLMFTNGTTGQAIGAGSRNGNTYTIPYRTGAAGPLALVALATDAAGNSQPATVNVTVGSTTTTPATPALKAGLAITVATIVAGTPLTYTVTPEGGTDPYAYRVVATNNATGATTVLGTDAVGSWTPQVAGSYNIDARVTDSSNPQKTVDAITRTLRVDAPSNQLPTAYAGDDITIQAPNSQVQLGGNGSDAEGPVMFGWVQLSGPNNATGLPSASQNVVVSNLVIGNYQFQLTVTDSAGATKTDTVSVTKTAAPVAGADPSGDLQITGTGVFNKGGNVTFSILPVVASGRTAVSVVFKTSTGTVLNTDTSSPFSYTWTPPNTGTYYVHAEITDSAGTVGSSLARTITVNSGAAGPDPSTYAWGQLGAPVRPVSLFHQTLPRQLVANSAADFANFDLAVSPGGSGSATWNSALNLMQITVTGAYAVFTSKVKTRAAYCALQAMINGYQLSGNATGAQIYLGLWEPGVGLRGVGSSFSCFPGQLDGNSDQYNYLGDGAGRFDPFPSHNYSINQTVREPVRVAITGDYVTAIRGTLDAPYYTDGTYCVTNNFGPTWNALLDNCCWGIIISTDGTLTVNLESLEAGWFGGTGRSDNKWGQNEDASPYVGTDGNFRDVCTLKGLGLKGFDTPDFVATAIDTYNLETKATTPTSLVFMRYPDVGRTVGNASTQFGYYPSRGGSYIWFSPAWGLVHGQTPATGTGIQKLRLDFAETMVNVFEPGVHILTPTKRNESLGMAYDCSIAVVNPAGGYDMCFSVSTGIDSKNQGFPDFYGHVAHTNDLMSDSWTPTADLVDGYYEGGTAIRLDGAVRFAFGKHYEAQFRLYTVAGQYLGIMTNPMPGGQSAHPAVIAFTDSQGRSGYLLRTFDTGVNSYFRTGYLYDNGSTYTWIYYLP
jgi:hypothetical protein